MKIVINYIIDDKNMSDEEYETQEEKTVEITSSDLHDILRYGRFNNPIDLNRNTQSIGEITNVRIDR